MKKLIFATATTLASFSTQAQTAEQKATQYASLSYCNGYASAANDVGTMLSKFKLVEMGAMTAKDALDYYNLMLSKKFGKATTVAQAEKLTRQKGFQYMEITGLKAMGNELIRQSKTKN